MKTAQVHLQQRTATQHNHQLMEMREALQQSEQAVRTVYRIYFHLLPHILLPFLLLLLLLLICMQYQSLLEAVCKKLSIPGQEQSRSLQNANRVDRLHILKERDKVLGAGERERGGEGREGGRERES